jgi:hypothetical protein
VAHVGDDDGGFTLGASTYTSWFDDEDIFVGAGGFGGFVVSGKKAFSHGGGLDWSGIDTGKPSW